MARVLVLDDDESLLKMLLLWLTIAGFEAEGAGDGDSGLRLLETKPFDLVVTDIVMPNKEELETIPAIRKKFKDLPIIAISGGGIGSAELYLDIAQQLGVNFAFQKPFGMNPFLDAVRECLSGGKPEPIKSAE